MFNKRFFIRKIVEKTFTKLHQTLQQRGIEIKKVKNKMRPNKFCLDERLSDCLYRDVFYILYSIIRISFLSKHTHIHTHIHTLTHTHTHTHTHTLTHTHTHTYKRERERKVKGRRNKKGKFSGGISAT